jgi:uncharacterized protein YidB (DUF937 family)
MGLLDSILLGGRRAPMRGGGMSPLTMALMGLLAYRTLKGKGKLADMLNKGGGLGQGGGMGGGLGGLLGGLLGGGAAGGALSGGLNDLLESFKKHGQADKVESWVAKGQNKPMTPAELEQALGSERINWLMMETGMSREELLAGLSRELPEVIDQLTPDGHVPTPQEAQRLI